MKTIICTVLYSLFLSTAAFAVPYLQLDVTPSQYDDVTDTVISTSPVFTLTALVDDNHGGSDYFNGKTYYLSASLVKDHEGVNSGLTDFGSFNFAGSDYSITDMTHGSPPTGGMPPHGIFDTYFREFEFVFDEGNITPERNVEPNDLEGAADSSKTLYYANFDVDVTNLAADYEIHFDLYTKLNGSVHKVAPFSHDAESGGEYNPQTPEPATLLLLGFGLLGLAGASRKKLI